MLRYWQILLDTIATGNGIRLLRDILVWTHVAHDTGNSPLRLSFQRGYYPLLAVSSLLLPLRLA